MITLAQVFTMIAIGLFTGVFSGVFGIGGGVVIVPILIFLMGYPPIVATGTSLVALLLPVGFLGVWQYYSSGKIAEKDIKMGLLIAVGLFFGTYLGAKIAIGLPAQTMRKSFAVFLIFIAAKLWWT